MHKNRLNLLIRERGNGHMKNYWVDVFDEEDWEELLRSDSWEPFEDGKAFMRVV